MDNNFQLAGPEHIIHPVQGLELLVALDWTSIAVEDEIVRQGFEVWLFVRYTNTQTDQFTAKNWKEIAVLHEDIQDFQEACDKAQEAVDHLAEPFSIGAEDWKTYYQTDLAVDASDTYFWAERPDYTGNLKENPNDNQG